jgi:hypothetical protein
MEESAASQRRTWRCRCRLDAIRGNLLPSKEEFILNEDCLGEDDKLFFKLFTESTFDGSSAAARTDEQIAKEISPSERSCDSQYVPSYSLLHSEMLLWTNKLHSCVAPVR